MGLIKFEVHTSGFENIEHLLKKTCSKAELVLAAQIEKDTRPFVPAQNLSLANRTHTVFEDKHMFEKATEISAEMQRKGKALIVYPGPYARYLYYGKVMEGPATGPKHATDKDLVFSKSVNPFAQAFWFEASKAQNLDKWERVAQKAVEAGLHDKSE